MAQANPWIFHKKTKSWSKRDFKRKAKFNWAFLSRWYTLNSLHVPRWCHKQIPEYRRIIKLTPRGNFIKIILKLYIVIGILKPCFNKSEAILQIREVTLNFIKKVQSRLLWNNTLWLEFWSHVLISQRQYCKLER